MKRPTPAPIRLAGQPTTDDLAALREATRQAHEVLTDLRRERRAVEQLVAGIEGRVQRAVKDLIETAVEMQVGELGKATERAMDAAVAKVGREFDRLERIFTGRDDLKRPPLEDLIRRRVATDDGRP